MSKCGFKDWLDCKKECRWYLTCTRNPHNEKEDKDKCKNINTKQRD